MHNGVRAADLSNGGVDAHDDAEIADLAEKVGADAVCHGATGTPSAAMTKAMGIKSASDPAIMKLTSAEMSSAVKNGKGKMKPIAGLTNQQITDVVAFYRSLK